MKRNKVCILLCGLFLMGCAPADTCESGPMTGSFLLPEGIVIVEENEIPASQMDKYNPTAFRDRETTVRVPAEGDNATGYIGCEIGDLNCSRDKVQSTTIPAFEIGVHPVTVGEMQACIDAGKCKGNNDYESYVKEHPVDESNLNQPAFVPYEMAEAYCEFKEMSLPTPEQWLAAAMGNEVRDYSWGNGYIKTACLEVKQPGKDTFEDVMSYPRDQYQGIYDMSGNGYEWVEAEIMGSVPESGGLFSGETQCGDFRSRLCMGGAPLPLYQYIGVLHRSFATFRCVK